MPDLFTYLDYRKFLQDAFEELKGSSPGFSHRLFAKKAGFVRQVAAELGLPKLRAEHARVETLRIPAFDLITSRAFASLADAADSEAAAACEIAYFFAATEVTTR